MAQGLGKGDGSLSEWGTWSAGAPLSLFDLAPSWILAQPRPVVSGGLAQIYISTTETLPTNLITGPTHEV